MKELSIKIKIADREYPMKVDADDEAQIRRAGKLINEKLKMYRDQFGIDDKQDLLAMVAFDSFYKSARNHDSEELSEDAALDKISYLNKLISDSLNQT